MCPGRLEHRIAEHHHQSLAIKWLQTALETPAQRLGQDGVNAMLLAVFLLNMIALTLPHQETEVANDPKSSWVFSSSEDELRWLALQTGMRPLLISLSFYIEKTVSFLDPIMFGHRNASWAAARKPRSLDIVPELWVKAFKLKEQTTGCESNGSNPDDVLRPAAIALAYLRSLDRVQSTAFINLMFLNKIYGDFRKLLCGKDERALWLVGYWLGLMCQCKGVWWCGQRVRRDYQAVRIYLQELELSERAGDEGAYWKLLMRELELAPVFSHTNEIIEKT